MKIIKVYGIADLHLSFGVEKRMNIFGQVWENYEEKIKENWIKKVKDEDVVIIAGDISWGTYLPEAKKDFEFLNSLPGKKIILRGNHDYYFATKNKMDIFFRDNNFNMEMLYNNAIDVGKYIVCGTRGWGETAEKEKDYNKIMEREYGRLKISLNKGKEMQEKLLEQGIKKDIIVAIHFPPFDTEFEKIMQEYKVKKCIYGHLHGVGHLKIKEGNINGVEYSMVSVDYTNFDLVEI